jgi:formiminoglutamate deiminase
VPPKSYDHPITHLSPRKTSTTTWIAEQAWLGGPSLVPDVTIEEHDGVFTSIKSASDASPDPPAETPRLRGVVLPGLVNAHSHAFHRLLRGRTHRQGGDFWLWRERMYEIAALLGPETYEALATAVYVEMALTGITTVGEFHYLHHQADGVPYDDRNEMGHALIRAARAAGIRIALLDAGYLTAGFDDAELDPVQTRFSDGTAGAWLERVAELCERYPDHPDVVIGFAPHSVRAVPESGLARVAESRHGTTPVHIHVSEQPAENRDCLAVTGVTPTGLLDRVGLLGPTTTLVHATHLADTDIATIGRASATVCYCATTERDLADGIGPAGELDRAGARLCVGSDSHAVIDTFEEARGIELHTRLATGKRGHFAPAALLAAATGQGGRSLGFTGGGLEVGSPADFIVVDPDSPRLAGMAGDTALDTIVFAATSADVTDVFVGGQRIVSERSHPAWTAAQETLRGWGSSRQEV